MLPAARIPLATAASRPAFARHFRRGLVLAALSSTLHTGSLVAQSESSAAGEPDAHGITMDATARSTLDAWERREYHLGRAGIRQVQCTVTATVKGALGDATGKGKYTFTKGRGTLKWTPPEVRRVFAERGWTAAAFDRLFVTDARRRGFKGTRWTSRSTDPGTEIQIEGDNPANVRSLVFDAEGKLTTIRIENPREDGAGVRAEMTIRYAPIGRRLARSGWSLRSESALGTVTAQAEIERKAVGKFRVIARLAEKIRVGDRTMATHELTFTEYNVNGILVEPKPTTPKAAVPPESGPAAGKPAGKPAESGNVPKTGIPAGAGGKKKSKGPADSSHRNPAAATGGQEKKRRP